MRAPTATGPWQSAALWSTRGYFMRYKGLTDCATHPANFIVSLKMQLIHQEHGVKVNWHSIELNTSESDEWSCNNVKDNMTSLATGVFTPLTPCYSPICRVDQPCYSKTCPNTRNKKVNLNFLGYLFLWAKWKALLYSHLCNKIDVDSRDITNQIIVASWKGKSLINLR